MEKCCLVLLVAVYFTFVDCYIFPGGRWIGHGRGDMKCRLFGMKPVVNPIGKVTKCVPYCESHHSSEYSYIHGHHCKELPQGCATSDCSVCKPGFFKLFDHGKVICVEYCPDHHVEKDGKCVEIPRGCKDITCTECQDGFFASPYRSYYGNKCRRTCPYGYEKNTDTNSCDQTKVKEGCADILCFRCKEGYYKYLDSFYMNHCVQQCPVGFGVMNNRCREVPTGCVAADCSQCRDGYFKYKKGIFFQKCRKSCPSGYFADIQQNLCVRCDDVNCVHCSDSPSLCHECRVPFALLQSETENVTKCMSKCPEGFKLNYSYDWLMFTCQRERDFKATTTAPTDPAVFTNDPKEPKTTDEPEITNEPKTTSEPETTNEPTTTKQPTTQARERTTSEPKTFPPGCEDQFCLKCLDGYFRLLIFGDGLKCVKKCPPGYFNFSNDCIYGVTNKPAPLPEGCRDRECRLPCRNGFYKLYVTGHDPKCVRKCPIGYFTALKNCIACHEPRCKHCTKSPFTCESCRDGFITFQSDINSTVQCLDRCPKGFKRIIGNGSVVCEKKPVKECNIDNCELCADHELHSLHIGCVECRAGFLLKRNIFKDECIAVCPDGFYAGVKPGTGISACLNCDVQFCQQCVKRKKCTRCYEPFVFDYKQGLCTLCKAGTSYNKATRSCKPDAIGGKRWQSRQKVKEKSSIRGEKWSGF